MSETWCCDKCGWINLDGREVCFKCEKQTKEANVEWNTAMEEICDALKHLDRNQLVYIYNECAELLNKEKEDAEEMKWITILGEDGEEE